ncbi:MAG: M48 family metallopeptidase [Muribaculaceae bacterium]|nr:M48 family metallopeptidase [Muribaculaceae bacterium]MDE6559607.1 M48 family metallopeptidase [Muribaculaceae bacterium]
MKISKMLKIAGLMLALCTVTPAAAQFNLKKAVSAASKGVQALTLTDEQMAAYVKQSVDWMDKHNPVLPDGDPYVERLKKLTANCKDADGIPLNFKVYDVIDVNAFACPDGSVRVFSSLMDIMSDDELMGVIGHEIGHVIKRHSKNALKQQLLTDAALDAAGAANNKVAMLTDSQLGGIAESLMNAKYSQKQESEADDCGYDFLVANGLNPWGMSMAFEKLMGSEGGAKQSTIQKMFSSHPDTKKRIEKMSKRAEKDGYTKPETK